MTPVQIAGRVRVEEDHSIHQEARSLLEDSGYSTLSKLDCRVRNGIVELTGSVPSFYLKQLAQAVILRAARVREVRNRVRVGTGSH